MEKEYIVELREEEADELMDEHWVSELIRCKDCRHRPKEPNFKTYENGFDIEFPEDSKCPCQCSGDQYYSWYPEDDWFCANGEVKQNENNAER